MERSIGGCVAPLVVLLLVPALGPAVTVASRTDGTLWHLTVAPFAAAVSRPGIAMQPLRSALRGVERSVWSTLRGGCRELLEYGLLPWLLLALVAVLPAWTTAATPITGALLLRVLESETDGGYRA